MTSTLQSDDDILLLNDDDDSEGGNTPALAPAWRVLIVDDDRDVHEATLLALGGQLVMGRPLEFLHAYSSREALGVLQRESDVAVVFLDVVMETPDAGLRIISDIRERLGLHNLRIVLRTGQPGYAPDIEVINRYEIDDYRTKGELTRSRLYTTLVAALRCYDRLTSLERARAGMEHISQATGALVRARELPVFAMSLLSQLGGLLRSPADGFVCTVHTDTTGMPFSRIVAAGGRHASWLGKPPSALGETPGRLPAAALVDLPPGNWAVTDTWVYALIPLKANASITVCLDLGRAPDDVEQRLLGLFCANASVCAANMALMSDLHTQAYTDALVGLPNRAGLFEAMDALRDAQDPLDDHSLIVVDIDNFAGLNETFGDAYGDQVLVATSQRLAQALPSSYVARVASNAFAVLGLTADLGPASIQALFEPPLYVAQSEHVLTVSVGRVAMRDVGDSASEGLGHALLALKRAKSLGQQQFAQYTPVMASEARERAAMLRDLRQVMHGTGLYLAYQPQIDLPTGCVVGVEALIRWKRPDGQHITPDRFLPVAEQSGLIVPLGVWVLRTALSALRTLQQSGWPGLRMAVNVSMVQLRHGDFAHEVDQALRQFRIAPSQLELEITESIAALGWDLMVERLESFRRLGVMLAVDDFGTGFSSLSYLDRLPIDRVKIDRAFVQKLDTSSGERIPSAIVLLGHQLGLTVLAEGVETAEQAAHLGRLGCDEVQGYLYARPMPLDDLIVWLADQTAAGG